VLIEGDGEKIASGDTVMAHLLIANGVDKQVTSSDFDGAPQMLTVSQDVFAAIREPLEGVTAGSRVLVAAPPEDAFGDNGPQFGIGNKDTVVFVIDVDSKLSLQPHGTKQAPPAWAPKVTESDGTPTALDFAGTPKPGKSLQVAALVKGDGKAVKKGQTVYVNYLGQTFGGKQPFDESYSKGQPFPVQLGATSGPGAVIKGWSQGLEGATVGSRLLLSIPPDLAYGAEGRPDGGIPPNSTLFFVIDVLAAS